jgi:hypothetical protein
MAVSILNAASFDVKKLAFSAPKKLDNGATVNISYDGAPLVIKSRPMRVAFDLSKGFVGKGAQKTAADSNKYELQLEAPDNSDNAPMRTVIKAVNDAIKEYIKTHGPALYGEGGLGLKGKALADKLKEIDVDTLKSYYALPPSADARYSDKLKLKWNPSQDVKVVDKKNQAVPVEELVRGVMATCVFKVRGIFVNSLLMSVQLDAVAFCIQGGASISTLDLFADELDEDAKDDASRDNKRTKVDDGDACFPASPDVSS